MADEIDELERRGAAIRKIVGMHHRDVREHRELVRSSRRRTLWSRIPAACEWIARASIVS
jgi:hypothetical protein